MVERGGCQGEGGVLAEWHEAEAGWFPRRLATRQQNTW